MRKIFILFGLSLLALGSVSALALTSKIKNYISEPLPEFVMPPPTPRLVDFPQIHDFLLML